MIVQYANHLYIKYNTSSIYTWVNGSSSCDSRSPCSVWIRAVAPLTLSTVVTVHLLKASGAGTGVGFVAGETQVTAAPVVAGAAISAPWETKIISVSRHIVDRH